ncbi:MAG TPA: hypothetical protein P5522_12775 [Spirochaetia bacterium]|nr:hypothetical protein [Spirochaetia bacterium]
MYTILDFFSLLFSFGFLIIARYFFKYKKMLIKFFTPLFIICFLALVATSINNWRTFYLYEFCFILLITDALNIVSIWSEQSALPRPLFIIGIIFGILAVIAVYAFPIKNITPPTGEKNVGTTAFMLIDENRKEIYGPDSQKGCPRRIMVQVWYPALPVTTKSKAASSTNSKTAHGKRTQWLPDRIIYKSLAQFGNLPPFAMSHLGYIMSNSYENVYFFNPSQRYPVIIISHGWGGSRFIHTNLAEEYASHGFIVLAIDHSYGSLAVQFPDGLQAIQDKNALGTFFSHKNEAYWQRARVLEETYAADTALVLDYILTGKLPLELPTVAGTVSLNAVIDSRSIGLIAHSTGAGAGYYLTQNRSEIKAFIALDAWLEPVEQVLAPSLSSVLQIGSAQWEQGHNADLVSKTISLTPQSMSIRIKDSTHMDMAMIRYLTNVGAIIKWSGTINSSLYEKTLRNITLNWFTSILINHDFEEARLKIESLRGTYPVY